MLISKTKFIKNKANCSDRKALAREPPQLDSSLWGKDDLESVLGYQFKGKSVFLFSRKLYNRDEKMIIK